jgi:hypothetical protein
MVNLRQLWFLVIYYRFSDYLSTKIRRGIMQTNNARGVSWRKVNKRNKIAFIWKKKTISVKSFYLSSIANCSGTWSNKWELFCSLSVKNLLHCFLHIMNCVTINTLGQFCEKLLLHSAAIKFKCPLHSCEICIVVWALVNRLWILDKW